jgi:hypothetical protein
MNRELFRATGLPVLQNRTYTTEAEARDCVLGDVVLVQGARDGLVFNVAFDPGLLRYDADYQNEQANSAVFQAHLREVRAILARHCPDRHALEIGCGKGVFLEMLSTSGWRIFGVDPAYEGDNPRVVKAEFSSTLDLSAPMLVLRHVLEHVPNPRGFLQSMRAANHGKGSIYIEVPCFDWILARRAWFDIFYEHVNYFRLEDFRRLFARVHEAGHLFGGQYIYVVADLASLRDPVRQAAPGVTLPNDFLAGVGRVAEHLRQTSERRHLVWGAASKGVIFATHLRREGVSLDGAIDINPAKQGRFLPVTGLRVYAPDEAVRDRLRIGDNVIIMNSNYAQEIMNQSAGRYRYVTVDQS